MDGIGGKADDSMKLLGLEVLREIETMARCSMSLESFCLL
jgi:hypothetical protein